METLSAGLVPEGLACGRLLGAPGLELGPEGSRKGTILLPLGQDDGARMALLGQGGLGTRACGLHLAFRKGTGLLNLEGGLPHKGIPTLRELVPEGLLALFGAKAGALKLNVEPGPLVSEAPVEGLPIEDVLFLL